MKKIQYLVILCLALGLSACVGKNTSTSPAQEEACEDAYTLAPATYVINVAMGEAVILDPVASNFRLYCTPQEARDVLRQYQASGRVPSQIEWKIYRVYGNWNDIATEIEKGVYTLNRPVPLVDWVDEAELDAPADTDEEDNAASVDEGGVGIN